MTLFPKKVLGTVYGTVCVWRGGHLLPPHPRVCSQIHFLPPLYSFSLTDPYNLPFSDSLAKMPSGYVQLMEGTGKTPTGGGEKPGCCLSLLALSRVPTSSAICSKVPVPTCRPRSSRVTCSGVPVPSSGEAELLNSEDPSSNPPLLPNSQRFHHPLCSVSPSKAFVINSPN